MAGKTFCPNHAPPPPPLNQPYALSIVYVWVVEKKTKKLSWSNKQMPYVFVLCKIMIGKNQLKLFIIRHEYYCVLEIYDMLVWSRKTLCQFVPLPAHVLKAIIHFANECARDFLSWTVAPSNGTHIPFLRVITFFFQKVISQAPSTDHMCCPLVFVSMDLMFKCCKRRRRRWRGSSSSIQMTSCVVARISTKKF